MKLMKNNVTFVLILVQWSHKEDFSVLLGEKEQIDIRNRDVVLSSLTHGSRYWFRAMLGNAKGYTGFSPTHPASTIPSGKGSFTNDVGTISQIFNPLPCQQIYFAEVQL